MPGDGWYDVGWGLKVVAGVESGEGGEYVEEEVWWVGGVWPGISEEGAGADPSE